MLPEVVLAALTLRYAEPRAQGLASRGWRVMARYPDRSAVRDRQPAISAL
jgi:hypothetical protein